MPQSPTTVYDVLAQRCAVAPGGEAVIDGELRLTNEMLQQRVDAVAKRSWLPWASAKATGSRPWHRPLPISGQSSSPPHRSAPSGKA
jgi:hypothetical protein